jgi:hypothetical protein
MSEDHPFIAGLCDDARKCEEAESEFRRTMNTRVAELAEARAFANRRMNVMRSLFETVSRAGKEDVAVADAVSALRNRLGWRDDSNARTEVLAEYSKVAQAAFAATHVDAEGDGEGEPRDVSAALADFEAWYLEARGKPFWVLFEHYMPETQLVDF